MEVKAFGEHQILDTVCSQRGYNCNNVVTFVFMLLFLSMVFWTGFPRFMRWYIYDENVITLLCLGSEL